MPSEVIVEGCFSAQDGGQVVESFEMSFLHVGNDAVLRFDETCEKADFAWVVGSGFDHSILMVGQQSEESQRDSDVVVQIPHSCQHVIANRESRSDQLLSGSLAVGSGHLYKRRPERTTVEKR